MSKKALFTNKDKKKIRKIKKSLNDLFKKEDEYFKKLKNDRSN